MRQAFRPYVKLVSVPNTTRVLIDLTDSSGVKFDCNYIQVEAVSGAGTGKSFLVVPIITASSTATAAADMLQMNTMVDTASGIVGGAVAQDTGSVVLSLAPSDKSNSIYLSQSNTTPTGYVITYGNVRVTNSSADNKLPTGN
jgi:hypothetical protein